jgi:hypothetical protein
MIKLTKKAIELLDAVTSVPYSRKGLGYTGIPGKVWGIPGAFMRVDFRPRNGKCILYIQRSSDSAVSVTGPVEMGPIPDFGRDLRV